MLLVWKLSYGAPPPRPPIQPRYHARPSLTRRATHTRSVGVARGFDQPPSTERANKPWIGFLPALHYPSIYWWHYVMVSIIQPWTWDRGLLWLTLSFFIYITAKPVGYIYPKEISINTVKFLYQTIAHLDSSVCYLWDRLRWKSVMGNEFLTTI